MQARIFFFVSIFNLLTWSFFASATSAQVQEDATTSTLITGNGSTFVIDGGTKIENNLFHSFSKFSIPANTSVFFNNLSTVDRIIARVTGGTVTNIDGLIQANGSASLFIINPNGFIFGPNASLNIGGSFFASTAEGLVFPKGDSFSAVNPKTPSLLAVGIPIGLQFRPNSGKILLQDGGHNVASGGLNAPVIADSQSTGLQVQSGQTLAFIGGDVILEGGILKAESGRIELGSVSSGQVNLNQTSQGWKLDYGDVSGFQNIGLSQKALADASGSGGGSIHVQAANVSLTDGSLLFIEHQGTQVGESISINATEAVKFIGSTSSPNGLVPSGVINQTIAGGNGGEIRVSAQRLFLEEGGAINAYTFNEGRGSDIIVNASESIQALGSLGKENQSGIFNQTFGSGSGGNVTVSTQKLSAVNGGALATQSTGAGSSGNLDITANKSIEVTGVVSDSSLISTISTSTGGSGNAGALTINTGQLAVRGGSTIVVATLGQGDAGTLIINASESVEVSGRASESFVLPFNPSSLGSSALVLPKEARDFFGLPDEPSGATGNVIIKTPRLTITDGANVNISHEGTQGNAGNLEISAGSILLENQGNIKATTRNGKGGNIALKLQDNLQLRSDGFISATAGDVGDGGNIDINAKFLIAFPPTGPNGSDIIANAVSGSGGNITITSQGVFGIAERQAFDGNMTNDIEASSRFGRSGQIQINTTTDPNKGLVELPITVIDPDYLVAQNPCRRGTSSEFTLSGRGGLPPSSSQDLSSESTQVGLVEPTTTLADKSKDKRTLKESSSVSLLSSQIAPAQGWIYNSKGEVVLVAYKPTITGPQRLQSTPTGCPVL